MSAPCPHSRGDHIKEMGLWLCGDCFAKLDERPKRYGLVDRAVHAGHAEHKGPIQRIVWMADIAQSQSGETLNDFLRAMTRRIMTRTRPRMDKSDAYEAAIEMLKSWPDPFGHPDYCWSAAAAREMVDEEMQHWDEAEGNS